jgi:hypothetical protein
MLSGMSTPETSSGFTPKLALTRDEAAQAIGQSAVTIDRLTKRGLLRPSRATRRPVFPIWEIERFLRETSAEVMADVAPRREYRATRANHARRAEGDGVVPNLSSPSRSQEGGNEPSCRASSAEIETVRPIPPRAAGGPSLPSSLDGRPREGTAEEDGGAS